MHLKKCLKLCALNILFLTSCATTEPWRPQLFMADPDHGGVKRGQKHIMCSSTEFRGFACMSTSDLTFLYQKCYK